MARDLARKVAAVADLELLAPARLALLNLRYYRAGDDDGVDDDSALDRPNKRLLNRLNASGALYLNRNWVNGTDAIRFSVGQTAAGLTASAGHDRQL